MTAALSPVSDVIAGVARVTRKVTLPVQPVFDLSSDEEFAALLRLLPGKVQVLVEGRIREVEEIKMQAYSPVEVLYRHAHVVYPVTLDMEDMATLDGIGQWRSDGRLGLEGTLHRFGRIDTMQHTSLVTVRVAKAFVGIAEPLREWLERAEDGLIIMGLPGAGKTALLRDCLRILGERLAGRLFVNDSSNEILGDGFRPHPLTDWLSRVPIGDPQEQFTKLNQVVKNFQPRWMVVDEVSSPGDARAIAYAHSRGAKAVMTWHAGNLKDAYDEREEKTLWSLIQRNEQGLSGPPVAKLGILVRGRGEYVVFEHLGAAFRSVEVGELPEGMQVSVAQAGRWVHREATLNT